MDTNQENEISFEEFIAERLRDKGISVKRLAEITGITPAHLENLTRGNFDEMPSVPYFHGYVMRIAKVLDFDGEAWWAKIKKEASIKNSGPSDKLPRNRFIKKDIPKTWWIAGIAAILLIIYLILAFPRIAGKPALTIAYPPANPFLTTATTLVIQGTVQNADSLYLNGEEVAISPDGTWQKTVLVSQSEPNTFQIVAKKFLGGETDITEQIIYEAAAASSSATSSASGAHGASGANAPRDPLRDEHPRHRHLF